MAKIYLLLLILVTVVLSGCTLRYDDPVTLATPAPTYRISEPSTVYVDIKGSAFTPLELNVVKGTIVKWRNFDSGQHAITVNNVSSPPFDQRNSWSYTFNEIGSFKYNCSIHSWMKQGLIVVKESEISINRR